MTPLCRAALVFTLAALPACFCNAAPEKPADEETGERFRLDADSFLTAKLDAARDEIKREEWDKASAMLQSLLDRDGDPAVDAGDEKHPRLVGVHAEAQRLIAALQAAGKKTYQAAQGPRAADLLKEGVKEKDEQKIADVVRRFLNTDAGPDALATLAGRYEESGRYHLAAACYERLLAPRDVAKRTPEMLFHAWDAFRRTGDKEQAALAGKQLLDRMGDKDLSIGDQWISRKDVQARMDEPVETGRDWPMFGGDAGRSARRDGGMPFRRYDWTAPMIVPSKDLADIHSGQPTFKEKAETLFKTASDQLRRINQPVLPPMFPVTATVTMANDGKKHSLVVFRTHSGVVACDMAGGKMLGRVPINGSLDWMMSDNREATLNQWVQAYVGARQLPGLRPGVLFENTTIGALSTDGSLAYAVEDLAVPPPANFRMNMGFPGNPNPYGWPSDILDAVSHNRLIAYDLAAGCKTAWELPAADDKDGDLAGSFFHGAPLPLDGRLYVLNEKEGSLRLLCLQTIKEEKGPYKPVITFVLPLGTVNQALREDPIRRVHAALVSYGDGILVCPTETGCVVGVDLLTHTVAWVRRYEAAKTEAPSFKLIPGRGLVPPEPPAVWLHSAPIVSGGAVVVAPPDSDSLLCLDAKTGDLRWKNPRQDGDLYLAGVYDGRVLLVGKRTCRAYNLADGKALWTLEVGEPSGRGAASGGVYYLPLRKAATTKEPELCAIDLAKGKVVAHAPLRSSALIDRKTDALGNLLFSDGGLVSQTLTEVAVFPLLKAKLAQMDAALAKNPNDPDGLYSRAVLRVEQGDLPGGVDDLQKVIAAKPPEELLARARVKLYEALTQLLLNDFNKGEKYLKDYEELSGRGNHAEARRRHVLYFQLTGRGYEEQGRLLDALKAYAEVGGFGDDPLPSPDDPALTVSPAAWAAGHIADLMRKATPNQRKPLQEEIDRRLKRAKASDGPDD